MIDASKLYNNRYGKNSELDLSKINISPLLKSILSRASVRKFSEKLITKEILTILLASAQSAPSKSNLQQYSILVIQDTNIKTEISNLIGNTKWALTAPVFLLFLADIRRNIKISSDRGYKHKNNNVDTFMNSVIDAALSMQSMVIASEAMGLGVCPISMIRNIIEEVKLICNLPKGVFPIAGLAVGWPDEKAPVSLRLPQDIVTHVNTYKEDNLSLKINEYDERVFKTAPISKEKQRHVDLYGVAEKGTWSENISRQLSVPERENFKKWLKDHGINLE
ncbi:nitroreductase family protein [Alphaproteobacteria bacterium]|nr:nitroreductase family protein [Alphaproteobacteria bacterium]MDC1023335.1 nitroreductase family protein [Alphaproteobacteria bacterium]